MVALRVLRQDDDMRTQDGFVIDSIAKETMRALNLKFIRSSGNKLPERKARTLDRKKAVERFSKSVNLDLYAIHHCYNGLVGLVPREIHRQISHRGYFYRLKLSTASA